MSVSHRSHSAGWRFLAVLLLVISASGCVPSTEGDGPDGVGGESAVQPSATVLWVDSYHSSYPWSAGIEDGIRSVLEPAGISLTVMRMDTKRVADEDLREKRGREISEMILRWDPDVVIATDDNAQEYLVVPYLVDTDIPVIFAGVNWDASGYGYPASNVTGMVEVNPTEQLAELLRQFASGERLCIVSGDTVTDRRNNDEYNERFFDGALNEHYVSTWNEFQQTWFGLQARCEILLIGNNAGIEGWTREEAEPWIRAHTTVVTGSPQAWVSPYVLVSLANVAEEQGIWAARSALQVIEGADIASIPMAENGQGDLTINLAIADGLNLVLPPAVLRSATIYDPVGGQDD